MQETAQTSSSRLAERYIRTTARGPAGRRDPHLAFGHGEHFCLGASRARLEARVVCETLLARFPRFAVVGEPLRQRSTHFNGMLRLPVRLDPAT